MYHSAMDYQRRVWATVDAELLAKIVGIQDLGESASGVRPTMGKVILMLIKAGLESWKTADLFIRRQGGVV